MFSIEIPVHVTVCPLDESVSSAVTIESTRAAALVFVDLASALDAFASEQWAPWEGAPGKLISWTATADVTTPGTALVKVVLNVEASSQIAAETFAAEFMQVTLDNPNYTTSPFKQVLVSDWSMGA